MKRGNQIHMNDNLPNTPGSGPCEYRNLFQLSLMNGYVVGFDYMQYKLLAYPLDEPLSRCITVPMESDMPRMQRIIDFDPESQMFEVLAYDKFEMMYSLSVRRDSWEMIDSIAITPRFAEQISVLPELRFADIYEDTNYVWIFPKHYTGSIFRYRRQNQQFESIALHRELPFPICASKQKMEEFDSATLGANQMYWKFLSLGLFTFIHADTLSFAYRISETALCPKRCTMIDRILLTDASYLGTVIMPGLIKGIKPFDRSGGGYVYSSEDILIFQRRVDLR